VLAAAPAAVLLPPTSPSPPAAPAAILRAPAGAPARPSRPAPAGGEARLATSEVVSTRVRVQVTADPPALVTVDGAPQGRTPLRALSLTPGAHSFVFVNELLGEKLESKLQLGAGSPLRIHADFTSATPQVYLR
jgi:hypothetical protein